MAKFNFEQYRNPDLPKPEKGSPAYLSQRYLNARRNLLSVIIFSVINVVLLLIDGSVRFLFSASIPYWLPAIAVEFDELLALGHFLSTGAYAISLISLLLYLLCWLLSKDRRGWLIAALVLFSLDTLFMVGLMLVFEIYADMLMDAAFHIWVMYYLITGVHSGGKLLKAAQEESKSQVPAYYTGPELE